MGILKVSWVVLFVFSTAAFPAVLEAKGYFENLIAARFLGRNGKWPKPFAMSRFTDILEQGDALTNPQREELLHRLNKKNPHFAQRFERSAQARWIWDDCPYYLSIRNPVIDFLIPSGKFRYPYLRKALPETLSENQYAELVTRLVLLDREAWTIYLTRICGYLLYVGLYDKGEFEDMKNLADPWIPFLKNRDREFREWVVKKSGQIRTAGIEEVGRQNKLILYRAGKRVLDRFINELFRADEFIESKIQAGATPLDAYYDYLEAMRPITHFDHDVRDIFSFAVSIHRFVTEKNLWGSHSLYIGGSYANARSRLHATIPSDIDMDVPFNIDVSEIELLLTQIYPQQKVHVEAHRIPMWPVGNFLVLQPIVIEISRHAINLWVNPPKPLYFIHGDLSDLKRYELLKID